MHGFLYGRVRRSKKPAEIEKKGFLPEAKNKFYGRKEEQIDIIQELNSPNQILTIVGPGGTGKTSLALTIAEDQKAYYPGGVWFIDLSEVNNEQDFLRKIYSILYHSSFGTTLIKMIYM